MLRAHTDDVGYQFHWDAETYLDLMRAEVPAYERLQEATANATQGTNARAILELGTGTGETARRLLVRHPHAELVGVDSSEQMLAAAAQLLDSERVELRVGRIEDALPGGPFDVTVAALVVHHLAGDRKAELFQRIHAVLRPGARLVLADVVVPDDPQDAVTPLSPEYDHPSSVAEHLAWLKRAGFSATVVWSAHDLAVFPGERHP